MPDNEQPLTPWKQCKQIAESLSATPKSLNEEQVKDKLRAAILAQLAATGKNGAALAARLAHADGPIEAQPCDLEVWEQLRLAHGNGLTATAVKP
jgi:hypothetical protein